MSSDGVLSNFCLGVILGSYRRLAASGRLLASAAVRTERETLLLAWALADEVQELAQAAVRNELDRHGTQTFEVSMRPGQSAGAIDAYETQLQQHLTADPSLFIVRELGASKDSLMRRQVVACVLQRARDELTRSLHSAPASSRPLREERLALLKVALGRPALREATAGKPGRLTPGQASLICARRSKTALYPKAADSLCLYEGLHRFAPFALRRFWTDVLFERLASHRLFELAVGLALAEALSVVSGRPLIWNSALASDGVMATVGPFTVGWQEPLLFQANVSESTIAVMNRQTSSCLAFVQCAAPTSLDSENAAIRAATEALVVACRKEAGKGPRFEDLPLADCGVVLRRLFGYVPEAPSRDRLFLSTFSEVPCGRLLDLARRACCGTELG